MVEAACESDIDRVGGSFLNPASDSLAIERGAGAVSTGLAPSDGWGSKAGGAGEGRPAGRKREGRSAFIMILRYREGNRGKGSNGNVGAVFRGSINSYSFCFCSMSLKKSC